MPSHMPPTVMPTPAQQARQARQSRLEALGLEVRRAAAAGEFRLAQQAAAQALALAPGHPVVLGDLALMHMRLGECEQARPAYEQAVALQPDNENLADGLTECYGRLGLHELAAAQGRRALALKAAQVQALQGWPLPGERPPAFDATRPERNVIAFTLFGDDPRYCETAILNVAAAGRRLPAWRCRFYIDASVPAAVLQRLAAAGAQLIDMPRHAAREANPLMWRFLVLDDAGIDRFLLRDADSLISAREASAVQAWLDSGRWFHLMRDYTTHSELLLAGMWGGCSGVFGDVARSLLDYSRQPPRLSARLADQHWLREHAWPTVRQSVLAHDSVFGFDGALPFPLHDAAHDEVRDLGPQHHVGGDVNPGSIGGPSAAADGERVAWRLVDEKEHEVCSYSAVVRGGQWRARLPRPYTMQLQAGRWKVQIAGPARAARATG